MANTMRILSIMMFCLAGCKMQHPIEARELTINLGDNLTIDFVLIPAGSFQMGGYESEESLPIHKVTITKQFYMGRYEITQEQWKAIMGENPSYRKGDKDPVEEVGWEDCQAFLRKLNERVHGYIFRLPTEAEWEYSCRAGSTSQFCCGDDERKLGEYAWYNESEGSTHPVGQKKPNAWGLYDMHGNVMEWCADRYGSYSQQEQDDPTGPPDDTPPDEIGRNLRVVRGGHFDNKAIGVGSAYRYAIADYGGADDLTGLRIIATPIEARQARKNWLSAVSR